MIRHILLFKFYPDAPEDKKQKALSLLKNLGSLAPEVKEWSIGTQCRPSERNWDIAQVSSFESLDALDKFRVHPAHKEVTDVMREIADWHIVDSQF